MWSAEAEIDFDGQACSWLMNAEGLECMVWRSTIREIFALPGLIRL
jgi:hypothetical protein